MLPRDISIKILSYLSSQDLITAAKVSLKLASSIYCFILYLKPGFHIIVSAWEDGDIGKSFPYHKSCSQTNFNFFYMSPLTTTCLNICSYIIVKCPRSSDGEASASSPNTWKRGFSGGLAMAFWLSVTKILSEPIFCQNQYPNLPYGKICFSLNVYFTTSLHLVLMLSCMTVYPGGRAFKNYAYRDVICLSPNAHIFGSAISERPRMIFFGLKIRNYF